MTTATITSDQDAVVSEIHIAAPAERVFQALSRRSPTQTVGSPTRPAQSISGRWTHVLAAFYRYTTEKGTAVVNNVSEFECHGEILEFVSPRLFVYAWIANWHEDKTRATVVRWELTPTAGGTQAKVTHSGLAQESVARKDYSTGWVGVLDQLKKFVEG